MSYADNMFLIVFATQLLWFPLKSSTIERGGAHSGAKFDFFLFQDRFVSSGSVSSVEEDLVIYRLPGDKLGLGLRFDGGAKASEYVQRLFVQGP